MKEVQPAGLENDEYTRKTEGYLPTAEVAFIDEIFKANSAILNALLTLLNERLFDNGNQRLQVPLLCLVSSRAPAGHLLCDSSCFVVTCLQPFASDPMLSNAVRPLQLVAVLSLSLCPCCHTSLLCFPTCWQQVDACASTVCELHAQFLEIVFYPLS